VCVCVCVCVQYIYVYIYIYIVKLTTFHKGGFKANFKKKVFHKNIINTKLTRRVSAKYEREEEGEICCV